MSNSSYHTLISSALEAGRQRDYNRAAGILEKIVSETDQFPEAYLYLGRSYHALGDFEKAIISFKHFIRCNDKESAGYFFLARTLLTIGHIRNSIDYLSIADSLRPDEPEIVGLLGIAYLKNRQPDMASHYLGRAVELDGSNEKLYTAYINALSVHAVREFHTGDMDLSRQMLEFLVEQTSSPLFAHIYLGIICKESGEYDKALYHTEKALSISPDDPLLLFRRAAMLYFNGEKEKAFHDIKKLEKDIPEIGINVFEQDGIDKELTFQYFNRGEHRKALYYGLRCLKKDYHDPYLHTIVGEAHRNLGALEKARNHFTRALEDMNNLTDARMGLAAVAWQQQDFKQMHRELLKIRQSEPDHEIARYYYVLCLCKLNYPPEKTIPLLQKEIESSGPDIYLHNMLGEQQLRTGDIASAEKTFREATKMEPPSKDAYRNLLRLSSRRGNPKELRTLYDEYLGHFPDDYSVRRHFVSLLVDNEFYSEAIEQLFKISPYYSKDEQVRRLLALCYRKTADYRQASILYKELLRSTPDSVDYIVSLTFCYQKMDKHELALDFLGKALSYVTNSPQLYLIHGKLHEERENNEAALASYRKVLDISPDNWRAYDRMAEIYQKIKIPNMALKYRKKADSCKTGE